MLAPYSMRTLICVVFCFFLFSTGIIAQNSPDCRSAIPVCADAPIMGIADGGGDIDDFDPDVIRQSGCLEKGSVSSANIENNTSWFVFRAGTGGQVDTAVGAQNSKGGKSFITLYSTAMVKNHETGEREEISKIVPFLKPGAAVTLSRSDVDYVVTEYGCIN